MPRPDFFYMLSAGSIIRPQRHAQATLSGTDRANQQRGGGCGEASVAKSSVGAFCK
jgi:hypothetical protein